MSARLASELSEVIRPNRSAYPLRFANSALRASCMWNSGCVGNIVQWKHCGFLFYSFLVIGSLQLNCNQLNTRMLKRQTSVVFRKVAADLK